MSEKLLLQPDNSVDDALDAEPMVVPPEEGVSEAPEAPEAPEASKDGSLMGAIIRGAIVLAIVIPVTLFIVIPEILPENLRSKGEQALSFVEDKIDSVGATEATE